MDILKILLGSTLALIIGALIVFAGQLKDGMANADPEKLEAMSRQINAMEREIEWLKLQRETRLAGDSQSYNSSPITPNRPAEFSPKPETPPQNNTPEETEADLRARLARVEAEAEAAKEDVERAEKEASFLTERHAETRSKSRKRQRVIDDAIVIATIREWLEDPELGTFGTLKLERPQSIQVGTKLAIRRNSGILGKLEVKNIAPDGAIAEPITPFDEVKPELGDELILNAVLDYAR